MASDNTNLNLQTPKSYLFHRNKFSRQTILFTVKPTESEKEKNEFFRVKDFS